MAVGLIGLMVACEPPPPPVSWHTFTSADGFYTIELPDNLQAGYDMHEYANLQYYNLEKNIFLLGIEDAKDNLGDIKRKRLKIGGYFAFVEDIVLEKADTVTCESREHFEPLGAPGRNARVGDYYVTSQDFGPDPIYYRIAVFESNELFLQLVIWMPYAKHCDMRPMVDRITRSVTFL
jgi:hypothetical protein